MDHSASGGRKAPGQQRRTLNHHEAEPKSARTGRLSENVCEEGVREFIQVVRYTHRSLRTVSLRSPYRSPFRSHSSTVVSLLAEARVWPSGANAMALIAPWWPARWATSAT